MTAASFGRRHQATRSPRAKLALQTGEAASVPDGDTVLERLEENEGAVRGHALPFRSAVGEHVDVPVGQRGKRADAVDEALAIFPTKADNDIVIAASGPVAACHRAEEDDELEIIAPFLEQPLEKSFELLDLRAVR